MRPETDMQMVAKVISDTLSSPNETDSNLEDANVVDGLFAMARAIDHVARSLDRLGVNNASTPMGAIECLAVEVRGGFASLRDAVSDGLER